MSESIPRVIGFDVRQTSGRAQWSAERRSAYLLRPDVTRPLSVDVMVWPQAASLGQSEHPLGLLGSIQQALTLYPDLLSRGEDTPALIEIAVVADLKGCSASFEYLDSYLFPSEDQSLDYETPILGYEAADKNLISGLSNCQLTDNELSKARRTWASGVSANGLFRSGEVAAEYKTFCDAAIPEHKPFEVFRIRSVVFQGQSIQLNLE